MMKKTVTTLLLTVLCASVHAFYPAVFNMNTGYYPSAVMDITHDDTYIYVAKGDGLVIIDKATGEKTEFSQAAGTLEYTPMALALRGDELWIGTKENQLLYYKDGSISSYDLSNNHPISNLLFGSDGTLYACTYGLGTGYIIDTTTHSVQQFETCSSISFCITGHLCLDGEGTLWIGNYGGLGMARYGMAKYTAETGTVYMLWNNPDLPGLFVKSMAVDNDGNLWYVNYGSGERKLSRLSNDQVAESYVPPYTGYDMAFDDQNRLWMACQDRLVMMSNGEFTSYASPIESVVWTCIDIDGDDVYIGTDSQLLMFRDGTFTTLDVEVTTAITPPLQATAQSASVVSYNLQGRRIDGTPTRSGLYIKDGRKVVVR